jgi:hypothetical protein
VTSRISIQQILRASWHAFASRHRVADFQRRAAWKLRDCRTAALGGHVERCPEGHVQGVWFNSCRHRSCPQCAYRRIEQWLAAKKALLLPVDHYHVVFTLASELRELWHWNKRRFATLLFREARETLYHLLGEERRLGDARPGFLAALHTWGGTLVAHPHLHCLVLGGGLAADGTFRRVRNGYLLPVRQVAHEFRHRFCAALLELLERGELALPPELSPEAALRLIQKARRKKWNVWIQEPYPHGRGIAAYLARYMVGGPIKNHRLVGFDGAKVSFRYREHRGGNDGAKPREAVLQLEVEEFLRRVLSHVPPPRLRVVRVYGLYHHHHRAELEKARAELAGVSAEQEIAPDAEAVSAKPPPAVRRCPVCARRLVRGPDLPRWRDRPTTSGLPPPLLQALREAA